MFAELLALFGGRFDEYTFLVKVYPVSQNLDTVHVVPDSYSLIRIKESDMALFADVRLFFYYKNVDAVQNSAKFTLIFRRSELQTIPKSEFNDFLGVVAYNTNLSMSKLVAPNPINWLQKTGEPFSVN